jgi:DNA polymerase-3 subunit beta
MEINISKETFLKGLHLIQSIVEKRNTMPILANALIRTTDNSIEIVATDLEVGIKETVDAEIKTEGAITLSARKLFEIVKEVPTDELTLKKKENNWVEIMSGKAVFNMVGIAPEDFPSFPSYEDVNFMEIEAEVLKGMIEKTIISVSSDETRYNLNGVFFEGIANTGIRLVSTDGHRLALSEQEVDRQNVEIAEKGHIIPRKGVQEFKKLIEEGDGPVKLGFQDNRAILKRGEVVVVVRLIEGEFPDYRPVIPSLSENLIGINREAFIKSLKRISILSDEKTRGVKFDFRRGELTISTTNPGIGEAKESLEIDYDGNEISAGFNARYIIDFLNVMKEERITLSITDELSAALIKDGDSDGFKSVVMPMRI